MGNPESRQGDDREQLIRSIEGEARKEALRIREEARQEADRRRAAARMKNERELAEAEERARRQAEQMRSRAVSRMLAEHRRNALRRQEEIVRSTLAKVREELEKRMSREEYRDVLRGWIVEAVIGLRVAEADVNASGKERDLLNDGLLRAAEEELQELTGRTVALKLSPQAPLLSQGVVVTSRDRKLVFDNRVEARMQRYGSEIRSIVHDGLARLAREGHAAPEGTQRHE